MSSALAFAAASPSLLRSRSTSANNPMAKDVQERYQHVDEMIVDLKRLSKKLTGGKSTILRPAVQAPSEQKKQATRTAPISPSESTQPPVSILRRWERHAWALLATILAIVCARLYLQPSTIVEGPVSKWSFTHEDLATTLRSVAVSPNGRHIAYIAGTDPAALWIREIDRVEPRRLASTEGASWAPFWSPDSRMLAFTVGQELKKIPIEGGAPTTICRLPGGYLGGSWSPDGESVAFSSEGIVYEVPARGGQPTRLFEPEKTQKGQRNYAPHFLPPQAPSRSVVLAVGSLAGADIVLKNLETGESQVLGEGWEPGYSNTGHIVFEAPVGEQSGLWALPFSLETLRPRGETFPIAEVGQHPSVSNAGHLVFVNLTGRSLEQMVWRNRDGAKVGEIGQPQQDILLPVLSPDGSRVAVRANERGNMDVWVHETERPMKRRLTFDASPQTRPQWSPSGREITFQSYGKGNYDIFRRAADGTGGAELLIGTEASERPYGWSHDGNYLLYSAQGESGYDVRYLKRLDDGDRFESVGFLETPFNEHGPQLSPDGRFLAYCSNETGEYEVYVRPFPSGDGQWQVSTGGGCQPRWSHDGKELFYVEGDTLVAVELATSTTFATSETRRLFSDSHLLVPFFHRVNYDVSADGRFVLVDTVEKREAEQPSIHVVENWYEEFRDRERD